ncbi:MAG: TIM-barrel domain-containing protein [Melioribacteraceae bacterium]
MKKKIFLLVHFIVTSLVISQTQYPPISPKWVFEPWVWEDAANTKDATWNLINGYLTRNIPIGAVIIDSPWEAPNDNLGDRGYNTFDFDISRYNKPKQFIDSLNGKGIHVILWITGVITTNCPLYQEAFDNNYFVNNGATTGFWKGSGRASHIDFFNPEAVAFWKNLMDNVFDSLNVDGWKVDESDYLLRGYNYISTFAGDKTPSEYSNAYYSTIYNYTREKRDSKGMIMARPYCDQHETPYWYAPLSVNTAGWVGDQQNSWDGLEHALINIFISSQLGYAAVGSDIGGYSTDINFPPNKTLFLRWAQFGSLIAIMENGGTTNACHMPWLFDENTVQIYRYFAELHHELVPYLYSYDINAHLTKTSIVRPIGTRGSPPDTNSWIGDWNYLLGDNLFVSAIYQDNTSRTITFPEGSWINYWNEDDIHQGGTTAVLNYTIDKYPVFIRSGAIIPLNVDNPITQHGSNFSKNYLTLLIYPNDLSSYKYYKSETDFTDITCEEISSGNNISFSNSIDSLIIRLKNNILPEEITINGGINLMKKNTFAEFESSSSGWFHGKMTESDNVYTWIKFSNSANSVHVTTNCALNLFPENYELSSLCEGNKYYVDRDYTITTMPDKYRNFNMIKTANADKQTSNLNFHFNLCRSADVYIAYDHRLTTPLWITTNYINTNEKIYVSDPYMNYFNIWEKAFEPGIVTLGDNGNIDESSMYFVFYNLFKTLQLDLKVFLEGPFSSENNMNTTLLQNDLIPKSQPYNILPWNYEGSENVQEIPDNAVDWVLVELRTSEDVKSQIRRAGFLMNDGVILALDGLSNLTFENVLNGDYYIVIYHRNHLPVMSSEKVHVE